MVSRYFCHYCQVHIRIPSYLTIPTCPYCHTQFVEEETSYLDTPSGNSVESQSWMESHEHDGQDERYDPWYLEFLPAPSYLDRQQQENGETSDQQQTQTQLWEQDDEEEEDNIPWFPAEDTQQDNDSISSWITDRSNENDDDNKSELDSITREEQQWVTDEDDNTDESTTRPLFLSIPNNNRSSSSSSSSSSSLSLSSSVLSHPGTSSPSPSLIDIDQQSITTTNHPSSSNHRDNGLFRIERLLDMIYQGYSESENELDDTHYTYQQGFMDNLMDIFSDPMETPQTSTNSDIEQCIERLSKRTLLHGDSGTLQECTICQEPFGSRTEIIQMPCQHEYHSPCILQWLYVNATCPICRCPALSILERTTPQPLPLSPIIRQRRYSYPVISEDNENENENENDDDYDDQLSEYYEVTDSPPIWARSSSSSATHHLSSSTSSSSRTQLVYHHLHDC